MALRNGSGRSRHTRRLLFAGLLVPGLVMLIAGVATRDLGLGPMLVPALGGLVVAIAIAVTLASGPR